MSEILINHPELGLLPLDTFQEVVNLLRNKSSFYDCSILTASFIQGLIDKIEEQDKTIENLKLAIKIGQN